MKIDLTQREAFILRHYLEAYISDPVVASLHQRLEPLAVTELPPLKNDSLKTRLDLMGRVRRQEITLEQAQAALAELRSRAGGGFVDL